MTQEIVGTLVSVEHIPTMTVGEIKNVQELRRVSLSLPQIDPETKHVFHAGMYHRTVKMPANSVMTGVLIKIPTTVTIYGDVSVCVGGVGHRLTGHHVLAAEANRMQAFIAHAPTFVTMSFATEAKTVEEAESEFTDETDLLMSRRGFSNEVKGVQPCLDQPVLQP